MNTPEAFTNTRPSLGCVTNAILLLCLQRRGSSGNVLKAAQMFSAVKFAAACKEELCREFYLLSLHHVHAPLSYCMQLD